jgi:hypothetical protein
MKFVSVGRHVYLSGAGWIVCSTVILIPLMVIRADSVSGDFLGLVKKLRAHYE